MSEVERITMQPTISNPDQSPLVVVLASDHDRIIAELDVEIERQRNALEAVVGTLRMAAQSNLDSAERELLHDIANDIAQKHYPEGESLRESNVQLIAEREALTADKARLLAECDGLRQRQLWVESLIASFVVPHEALDDEATHGDQYDELMASWTLALTELRAYYHEKIIGCHDE